MLALEKVEPMNVSNTLPEKQKREEQHGFLLWKEGCPEGRQVKKTIQSSEILNERIATY